MPARVFISYRRVDDTWARNLKSASEALPELELYTFPDDEASSNDWRTVCRSLICASDGVVCLVGSTTAGSSNISWELDEARQVGLPVLLAGPEASALARLRGDDEAETVEDVRPEVVLERLRNLV